MLPGKASRYKDVEWLDQTKSPLDLEACAVWPATRANPLSSRLYQTPAREWVLAPGGFCIEISSSQAARLLISWGWPLPGDLRAEGKAHEGADIVPYQTLPLPVPVAKAKDDLVILFGPHDEPLVRGIPKPPLSENGHKIIKTLIEAGEPGLSLGALKIRTKHRGARGTLERIARRDPDWKYVIQFPSKARLGGYRIGPPGYKHAQAEAG